MSNTDWHKDRHHIQGRPDSFLLKGKGKAMSQDQILGALRIIIPVVLSYVAGAGWIEQSEVANISAAIVTVVAAVWSVIVHSKKNIVAATAAMPEVRKVELEHTEAGRALKEAVRSTPSATVTIATGL
jgi:hypothetical protein